MRSPDPPEELADRLQDMPYDDTVFSAQMDHIQVSVEWALLSKDGGRTGCGSYIYV